jgi:hypothetical protein
MNIRCNIARMVVAGGVLLAVSCRGALAEPASESLLLVKEGRSVATIVVPKEADEWTSKAAQWLKEYVQKASGAELTIVSEDQVPPGTLISVGHTKLAERAGIDVSDLKWDGCKLVAKANVLYLIGRDQTKLIASYPWVGAKGTCRAVLTFLEDFCGVRWFLPSPKGELVPQARNISVPADLSKTFTPAFAYTDGRSTYNTELDHPAGVLNEPGGTPASLANNFRKAMIITPGGHTYYDSVPAGKYFKDHPEYFALINGKRTGDGNHLCSSNPDVKRLILEYTRKRFDEGWECQSIGQEDGYLRCECAECEKLDNYRYKPDGGSYEKFMNEVLRDTPCERLFLLDKYVIDEVKKSHPDHKVVLMCYCPTAWPSKKIKYFGDNVIADVQHPNTEYIEAWRGKTSGMTGKTDWFNTQCPMGVNVHMSPRELAGWMRQLHQSGIIGISQYGEGNWGLQGPVFYLLGRLLGNPDQDYQPIIDEYCQGVYGKAGDSMSQFFQAIYARLEVAVPIEKTDLMFSGRNVGLGLSRTPTEVMLAMYTPQMLDQLERLLRQAEAAADTERAAGWVKLTRDQFDFIKLLTEALISYRDYQAHPNKENWLRVKTRVEVFDKCRTRILTYPNEYTDQWFPGHAEFCKYLSGGAVKETISYYVLWEERTPSAFPALAGRKAEILSKGIKGVAVGHGDSNYYSYFKEPFTLDFDQLPPDAR